MLLHDDDLIDPGFVSTCVTAMREREVGFVQTGARTINGNGGLVRSRENRREGENLFALFDGVLKGEAVTYLCNTLYNAEKLRRIGGFQSKGFAYQDVIANLKLAHGHGWIDIKEPLASYRIHGFKMGLALQINKWCEDSLAILELMCELMPEKESYFRNYGARQMCRRNFSKADKMMKMPRKLVAYATIARAYGFRHVPLKLLVASCRRSLLGMSG